MAIQFHWEEEDKTWWADDPEVPGFTAVGDTFQEVWSLANEGVAFAIAPGFVAAPLNEGPGNFFSVDFS